MFGTLKTKMIKSLNKKLHTPLWLFILLAVVMVMRIPSLFEPYSYGDEMIYLVLGEGFRQGVPLYSELHDNKPPLLYITAGISGSLFWFRAILAVWNLVTIFIFWKLSVLLFPKKKLLQKISTTVFAVLTTIPLLEGNIANSEMFMIGFTMMAFYILLKGKLSPKNVLLSGILFSIAALYKIPAAFDVPVIIFYWIATTKLTGKNFFKITKNTIILSVGFLIPIFITFVWYYFQGAFFEYFIAAFGQNVGYLSSFRPDDVQEPFLVKNGPLLLRGSIVMIGLSILFAFRKKLSKQYIFIAAWILLGLFAVTLSERPYPHYIIQIVPEISLLFGMLFTLHSIEQVLVIFPLTLTFFVPVYYNFWYYPTTPYYARFVNYATGRISKEEYFSSFGGNVLTDYEVAKYISTNSNGGKIFVWGDNATIYALSRKLPPTKFVVDYHINDFSSQEETMQVLQSDMPEYLVVLDTGAPFPDLESFARSNYGLVENVDGARIWRLLSAGLRDSINK